MKHALCTCMDIEKIEVFFYLANATGIHLDINTFILFIVSHRLKFNFIYLKVYLYP